MRHTNKWVRKPSPQELGAGTGWFREMDRMWTSEDSQYAVMARDIQTDWGMVTHVCIRNAQNTDIPWAEKQCIKNELLGEWRTAIEVFPDARELVDEANMYHLWLLPLDFSLPFTIKQDRDNNS